MLRNNIYKSKITSNPARFINKPKVEDNKLAHNHLCLRKGNLQKMVRKFLNEKNISTDKLAQQLGIDIHIISKILKGYKPETAIKMAIIKLYCATKWTDNKEG